MKAWIVLTLWLLVCSWSALVLAHPDEADDPGFDITSDFGPRNVAGSRFHRAIDFRRQAGQTVPLLEDGTVTALFQGATTNIIIVTVSGTHTLRYLHLFYDDFLIGLPRFSGGFMLAEASDGNLAIVKQVPGFPDRAEYIISANPTPQTVTVDADLLFGLPLPGTVTIQNAAGTAVAMSTNILNTTDHDVGPAGTSGDFPAHMHVDLGLGVSENPLYHITDRASAYIVTLQEKNNQARLPGYFVGPNDPDSFFIKLQVDSRAGRDLESVEIYVDQEDFVHQVREFNYGGKTDGHDPVNADTSGGDVSNGVTNGVEAIQIGLERFVFTDWDAQIVGPSELPEGEHEWIFVLKDIHDNTPFADGMAPRFKFNIDKTPPDTSIVVTP